MLLPEDILMLIRLWKRFGSVFISPAASRMSNIDIKVVSCKVKGCKLYC